MEDKSFELIVKKTIEDLDKIMEVSPSQRAKDIVKSAMGRSVRSKDPMFWPAGMLMLGLSDARRHLALACNDTGSGIDKVAATALIADINRSMAAHLKLWKDRNGCKIEYIDDALAGAALVKLYEQLGEGDLKKSCREGAEKIYQALLDFPTDEEGTIVYNAGRSASNVFADGAGQVSMFLSIYGRVFGIPQAVALAKTQLSNFKKHGMDERTGLPYHGYALSKSGSGELLCEKKGVLSWGRAAGWLIMGLSEYAKSAPDDASGLLSWYDELSTALLTYQRDDGGYGWQVQAMEGHVDMSATGMIVYGLVNGGMMPEDAAVKAAGAFEDNVKDGAVQNALSSCDDFGVHYQTYGAYPWGQGAVLAAISCGLEK